MQLTWIPDRRRYVGTQTEAKALKLPFEVRDIPTSKQELLEELNAIEERHERELAELRIELTADRGEGDRVGADEAEVAAEPLAPPVATVRDETPPAKYEDLADEVGDLPKERLLPVLGAAIARLHEVAGFSGWAAFTKDVYSWSPAALAVERGMGMLMMAFFRATDGAPPAPEPIRPILADGAGKSRD